MTVRFFTALITLNLLAGCAFISQSDGPERNAEKAILESEKITVPAGDENLKRSVEEDQAGTRLATAIATPLDNAIEPALQQAAAKARERLDSDKDINVQEDTRQIADTWVRLRGLFALDHNVDDPRIRQQLNWYRRHPGYIDRVVDRGARYLHHILNEIENRGLPGEYALLPVVESAFDPFAYSHGRAAGLWQFIPSTGKYFGLEQGWWHDQRRDVLASTDAALNYLDRLASRFDGDHLLALAAYNSGGGTVSKAMRKNRNRNRPTDFWSLGLPAETKAYVPKLIALAKIFDDPEAYGITLPPLEDKPYFEVVKTESQLDLAQAAELAGVDIDEIYLLNPSYNRWATSPDGPHRLLVPVPSAQQFRTSLANIDPAKRVSWRNYKVVSGDSLIRIANKFNTTPSVVREVNNIQGNMIRIGQQLLIPTAREGASEYALSASQRLAKTQSSGGKGKRVEHRIRKGDTFWDIARDHGVSVRQLASWNGMAPGDPLMPGKKLVVWSKNSANTASNRDSMVRKVGYRVRSGDSLSVIANRFAVNVSDIASWNNLNTSRYLQPGQSLVLYVDIRKSP